MPKIDVLDSAMLPEALRVVIAEAPLPGLDSGPACKQTSQAIPPLVQQHNLTGTLTESALWLLAGDLDRSHDISQQHDAAEGSFWHGIMHRREGDYGNSKYWFRRVGKHPVHPELAQRIESQQSQFQSGLPWPALTDPSQIADAIVDSSQAVSRGPIDQQEELKTICWWEWQLLFQFSQL